VRRAKRRDPTPWEVEREYQAREESRLQAHKADAHRLAFGPDLAALSEKLKRWEELAADPRNAAVRERLQLQVDHLRAQIEAAETAYQALRRRDQLRQELRELGGGESPEEKLDRLMRARPYGFKVDPEFLEDPAVRKAYERLRRNGRGRTRS